MTLSQILPIRESAFHKTCRSRTRSFIIAYLLRLASIRPTITPTAKAPITLAAGFAAMLFAFS
jgi:hypothetical protein